VALVRLRKEISNGPNTEYPHNSANPSTFLPCNCKRNQKNPNKKKNSKSNKKKENKEKIDERKQTIGNEKKKNKLKKKKTFPFSPNAVGVNVLHQMPESCNVLDSLQPNLWAFIGWSVETAENGFEKWTPATQQKLVTVNSLSIFAHEADIGCRFVVDELAKELN
jgi:hypothetical protein